jgi:predicted ATPase
LDTAVNSGKLTSNERSDGKRQRLADSGARFTSISLSNWRNFAKAEVGLQQRVFLVGANASGKSNFLDAFRFLRDIAAIVGGGFQEAVGKRRGVSSIRCYAARRYPDVEISVNVGGDDSADSWCYEIAFTQDNNQRPELKRERVTKSGREIINRPDDKDKEDKERLRQAYLEQVNANQEFRELAEFFNSISYYHIVPHLVREPERSVGKHDDPFGGDFLEQIAKTSEKIQKSRLVRIEKALRIAVPQLKELKLKRDAIRGTPHLHAKYEHWRSKGAWQTEDQFSDGTLRLMGLLWAVMSGSGLLLLEEPELSLNPEVIRYVPQMLARVQRKLRRQIILSTHSPELLSDTGISLDEILLLSPEKEGTSVSVASSIRDAQALLEGGATPADIVLPHTKPDSASELASFEV